MKIGTADCRNLDRRSWSVRSNCESCFGGNRSSPGAAIMGRITRMESIRRRSRSGVEWSCGISTLICHQCGLSTQERIATNPIGIGVYDSPSNSNADSMPKKTGGHPESSRSILSPDPHERWHLPARLSTGLTLSPSRSARRLAATRSGRPHQPLTLLLANSGVLQKCISPSEGRNTR